MADARARFLITADDRASKKLRGVKQEIDGIGKSLTRISRISLGGALSVGGLTALAQRSIQTADALGKTADRLGLTVEAFQEYQFAAEQSGINSRTFETAIQRLGRRFAEADKGVGAAKDAFEELGISTRDANGNLKTIDDLLPELADAFSQVNTQLERNRLAFKLFDSEGVAFVNLLREGSQGLNELREQARESGIVIREDLVRGAEEANDKLNLLSRIVSTQVTQAVLEATPAVLALTEAFTSLSVEALKGLNATGQGLGILAASLVESDRTVAEYRQTRIDNLNADILRLEKEKRAFEAGLTRDPGINLDEEIRKRVQLRDAIKANNEELFRSARQQREINDLIFQSQNVPRVQAPALGGEDLPRRSSGSSARNRVSESQRYIESLQRESDTLGLTSTQLVEYELRQRGATEAQIARGVALRESIDAFEAIQEIEKENARIFEESEKAVERANEEWKRFGEQLTETVNPAERLERELNKIDEALRRGVISADTWGEATFNAIERFEDATADTADKLDKTAKLSEKLGFTFASAFEDAIIEGENLGDVLKALEKDIIRIVTNQLITRPLADALGDFLKSSTTGGGDFFSSIFARAAGGPVVRDQAYLVGERGPELFMPQTSGQILSNADTRQAMARTVTVNVYGAKDPDEFRRSMPQVQRAARRAILSAS
ncbi:MAG: phage tail tape measure protein [Acidimicrobiia bacterium]|nr:phage tail tape measure protein [Acidimicrobiia bacterium]